MVGVRIAAIAGLVLLAANPTAGNDAFPYGRSLSDQLQRFDDWVGIVQVWAAERKEVLPALDGYCPVKLLNEGRWILGRSDFKAEYNGATYFMADDGARQQFVADPKKFAPYLDGQDMVERIDNGCWVEGKREHGIFCSLEGPTRIMLFASETTLERFAKSPQRYLQAPLPPVRSMAVVPDIGIEIKGGSEPRVLAREGARRAAEEREASAAADPRSETNATETEANASQSSGSATTNIAPPPAANRRSPIVYGRERRLFRRWRNR